MSLRLCVSVFKSPITLLRSLVKLIFFCAPFSVGLDMGFLSCSPFLQGCNLSSLVFLIFAIQYLHHLKYSLTCLKTFNNCFAILVIHTASAFTTDTVILKDDETLIMHLFAFLDNRKIPLRLCYRASVHGWSSQQFHQHCDDKADTVVLVKVGNYIFGGYTDQTWQGKNFTKCCL